MRVVVIQEPSAFAEYAATIIEDALSDTATPTLGVATGNTPTDIYRQLASRGSLAPSTEVFGLDEYQGIDSVHSSSFARYILDYVVQPCGLDSAALYLPPSSGTLEEIEDFEALHRQRSPLDIQILGVGRNGHIGFNEPGSSRDSTTRVVTLASETREDNRESFGGDVPETAITQGVATILRARKLLLVARGSSKAQAIAQLVRGEVSDLWPVTYLASHPGLIVLCDESAASLLARNDYSVVDSVGQPGVL
jgi:glucosamine-6-phosphate deaminase